MLRSPAPPTPETSNSRDGISTFLGTGSPQGPGARVSDGEWMTRDTKDETGRESPASLGCSTTARSRLLVGVAAGTLAALLCASVIAAAAPSGERQSAADVRSARIAGCDGAYAKRTMAPPR